VHAVIKVNSYLCCSIFHVAGPAEALISNGARVFNEQVSYHQLETSTQTSLICIELMVMDVLVL
jgi:hypothetical protein